MDKREAGFLLARYVVLALLGLSKLMLFYWIFTPLTVYPSYLVLSLVYSNTNLLQGSVIFFNGMYIQIIPACVAGAAYYLLLILNLTTPMIISKRIKNILFLFITFLLVNIFRILLFAGVLQYGYEYFDLTHRLVWYFGSTAMVVAIWFISVWLFKIREIPMYTDITNLFKEVIEKRKRN